MRNHLDMQNRLDKDGNRYGKVIDYRCVQTCPDSNVTTAAKDILVVLDKVALTFCIMYATYCCSLTASQAMLPLRCMRCVRETGCYIVRLTSACAQGQRAASDGAA